MHERHRSQRRLTRGPAGDRQAGIANRNPPHCRELHQKVMRMLAINQRASAQRFPDLKQFGVSAFAGGHRLEADHRIDPQLRGADRPARHPHPPVGHWHFVGSPRAALMIDDGEQSAVGHEIPARRILRGDTPYAETQCTRDTHHESRHTSSRLNTRGFRRARLKAEMWDIGATVRSDERGGVGAVDLERRRRHRHIRLGDEHRRIGLGARVVRRGRQRHRRRTVVVAAGRGRRFEANVASVSRVVTRRLGTRLVSGRGRMARDETRVEHHRTRDERDDERGSREPKRRHPHLS
jgi:hypothetical protein